MCKPVVRHLHVHSDGPCAFSIRTFSDACAAFWLGTSWKSTVANVLRHWADKAEGVKSLVIVAHGPPQITYEDVLDAATHGFSGANKYLNDIWRERVHGSEDVEAHPVTPTRAVS